MQTEFELDPSEIELLRVVGKMRHAATSQHSRDMAQDPSQDSVEMAILGVIGEYAASRVLNLHLDLDTSYRRFGPDLISSKGARIDVKTTTRVGGAMNARDNSPQKPIDVYVLVEVSLPQVKVVGWSYAKDFLVEENLAFPEGRRPYYSMRQSALRSFNVAAD